jgi:hypothetical protein
MTDFNELLFQWRLSRDQLWAVDPSPVSGLSFSDRN